MTPAFRMFFEERYGIPYPFVGQIPPPGKDWYGMIIDAMSDYLDLIAAKVFREELEPAPFGRDTIIGKPYPSAEWPKA